MAELIIINDRFEVIELIGTGGMASVYKVRDKSLDKVFAAKVLSEKLTHDQAAVKRFLQEAKASSTLDHQNIVSVYDSGTTDSGVPFIVMDYLEGTPLNTLIGDKTGLTFERAIEIFVQIADAIAHAHAKNLIHRDVKPSNIMLLDGQQDEDSDNKTDLIKVLDFGIAKVLPGADSGAATVTQTGEIFGSPLYMSPEQCKGEAIDTRSDIYSLGCLMYEAVSGKAAFNAENPFKVMMNHVQMEPEPFRSDVKIPDSLKKVIFCCLEKEPENRYQKMEALRDDLALVRDGKPPVAVKKPSKKKSVGKNQKLVWAAAIAATVVIAGGIGGVMTLMKPPVTSVAPEGPKRLERWEGKTLAEWSQEIEKNPSKAELYYNRGMLHDRRDERTNPACGFADSTWQIQ